jgi:hypothetical protein
MIGCDGDRKYLIVSDSKQSIVIDSVLNDI